MWQRHMFGVILPRVFFFPFFKVSVRERNNTMFVIILTIWMNRKYRLA